MNSFPIVKPSGEQHPGRRLPYRPRLLQLSFVNTQLRVDERLVARRFAEQIASVRCCREYDSCPSETTANERVYIYYCIRKVAHGLENFATDRKSIAQGNRGCFTAADRPD